jgi:8-oxo-dGTP pyrophosphatase MutT (NUDIX family)/GNAT superfamily N-acetyltransferase
VNYEIRKVKADEIQTALDLALRVFNEFEAADYEPEALIRFNADIVNNREAVRRWASGERLMFVALDGNKIVGVIGEKWGNGHINIVFVDGKYHRRGIATELTDRMVCELKLQGFDKLTLFSSPYGLPFYKHYGFAETGAMQKSDGFIIIPMAYEPNEIWDILDENGDRTGRLHERGRKMNIGDYNLVVHVWKHNGRGEWLIDRRAPHRGSDIDGKWETTGGALLAGEDSLTAALREAKEELGLDLDPAKGTLFHRGVRQGDDGRKWFQDAWVFEHDCPLESVKFNEDETCGAMWATPDKIREMMASGEFIDRKFYSYFDELVKIWERNSKKNN